MCHPPHPRATMLPAMVLLFLHLITVPTLPIPVLSSNSCHLLRTYC